MALTPEIEARGMKAYEQARAFERVRTWRLPLSYAVFVLVPVLNGGLMWESGHTILAEFSLVVTVLLVMVSWLHWRGLKARYAGNLQLLAELKAAHGDQLPWIQVENHLAALEQLKRELAGPADDGGA